MSCGEFTLASEGCQDDINWEDFDFENICPDNEPDHVDMTDFTLEGNLDALARVNLPAESSGDGLIDAPMSTDDVLGDHATKQATLRRQARPQDWDRLRPTIEKLYCTEGKRLKEVIEIMEADHDFFASEKQYTTRLRKWQVKKNMAAEDMRRLLQIRKRRKQLEGKDTAFVVHNRPVSDYKIARYIKKNGDTATSLSPPGRTPQHIHYFTPQGPDALHPLPMNVASCSTGRQEDDMLSVRALACCLVPIPRRPVQSTAKTHLVQLALRPYEFALVRLLHLQVTDGQFENTLQIVNERERFEYGYLPHPEDESLSYQCIDCGLWLRREMHAGPCLKRAHSAKSPRTVSAISINSRDIRLKASYQGHNIMRISLSALSSSKFGSSTYLAILRLTVQLQQSACFRLVLLHMLRVDESGRVCSEVLTYVRALLYNLIRYNAQRGDVSVISFLYRMKIITEDNWKERVFWDVLESGHVHILREVLQPATSALLDLDALMEKAADLRRMIRNPGTSEAVSFMIEAAANALLISESGVTALHLATACLLSTTVKGLLSLGADINTRMGSGETVLHILSALPDGDGLDMARILIENGADVTATDSFGDNCLHNALKSPWVPWRRQFMELLLVAGISINVASESGVPALHIAISHLEPEDIPEAVCWFLDRGADLGMTDFEGFTAQAYFEARFEDDNGSLQDFAECSAFLPQCTNGNLASGNGGSNGSTLTKELRRAWRRLESPLGDRNRL